MSVPPGTLAVHVAGEIKRRSQTLTKEWIENLSERLGVRPGRLVPSEDLLDHIPLVLSGVADFVELPVAAVASSVQGRLRLLAQLRREQGYDISELLLEFETLSDILSETYVEIIAQQDDPDPVEVARLAGRIRTGLARITTVTVATYRQEEQDQKRELSQRLSDFANAIAHELKTPLGAASAAVEMLMEEELAKDEEQQRRFTELVVRNLKRAMDLMADLRVLALAEGALAEPRWLSLTQVLKEVVETFQGLSENHGGVDILIDDEVPDIDVDAARVEIALANLISNAIKYSDPEKEERWAKISTRRLDGDDGSGRWRITVEDNGLGIPEEYQNNIFQRHFRAHPEAAEGSGLGLALTSGIVIQNGGSISFESTPGEGSSFHIDLPERYPQSQQGGKLVP